MPSLRELQQGFAAAVLAPPGTAPAFGVVPPETGAERIGIYRTAFAANCRNALGASYPVVRRLTGAPFFHAAVDAFVRAAPSVSGDLNVYGDTFGDFLAGYAPAAALPYLPDVARLEWAQDEAQRAADLAPTPDVLLAALVATPADRLAALVLALGPSCRLIASPSRAVPITTRSFMSKCAWKASWSAPRAGRARRPPSRKPRTRRWTNCRRASRRPRPDRRRPRRSAAPRGQSPPWSAESGGSAAWSTRA